MTIHTKDKMRKSWIHSAFASALLLSVSIVPANMAHAESDLAAAFDSGASFETLGDNEMSEARGGYRGVSFGVYFNGSVSSSGNTGELPAGMSVTQDGDNRVQLQAALGDLGGANGLFQFTNVVGDMNVVNNSIVINVMIVPDLPSDVAAAWR